MKKEGIGLGIAGFVLGLLSLIMFWVFFLALPMAIIGLVLSIIQIRRKSTGLAITGMILSIIGLFLSGAFTAIVFYIGMNTMDSTTPIEAENSIVLVKNSIEYSTSDGKLYKNQYGGSGIVYKKVGNKLYVITNRHVVDCVYTFECSQITKRNVSIVTKDGSSYVAKRVLISPHKLDIALLEFENVDGYPTVNVTEEFEEGDSVMAIGYPAFSLNVREYSKSAGTITDLRELLTDDGYRFEAIDSSVYTYFGSSGGGLFDEDGNLIGINTWGSDDSSYAINIKYMAEINNFNSCEEGYYFTDDGCAQYCDSILNQELKCTKPCNDFYRNSEKMDANDERCADSSEILGEDGFCYSPCGSPTTYCDGAFDFCYKNECTYCPPGYNLYDDGNCYK